MKLMGDALKLLEPLIKILNILFMVVFLPLMPLIIALTTAIASIIEGLMKLFRGEIDFIEFIKSFIGPALIKMILAIIIMNWKIIFAFLKIWWVIIKFVAKKIAELAVWLWDKLVVAWNWVVEKIVALAQWLWDVIVNAWDFIKDIGSKIWDMIKTPFVWLMDAGTWIWDQILKPAFEWLSDVGSKIWNIIKTPFTWLKNKVNDMLKRLKFWGDDDKKDSGSDSRDDFLMRPGQRSVSFSPQDTIIGVKDINKLGGGKTTININNPVVREKEDLKRIADEVSKELQRSTRRRFS